MWLDTTTVDLPKAESRLEILKLILRDELVEDGVDLNEVVKRTDGKKTVSV